MVAEHTARSIWLLTTDYSLAWRTRIMRICFELWVRSCGCLCHFERSEKSRSVGGKSLRGTPLSARDDTGVLPQARPMMASGARRGGRRRGAAAPRVRNYLSRSKWVFYYKIICSYLQLLAVICSKSGCRKIKQYFCIRKTRFEVRNSKFFFKARFTSGGNSQFF